MLKFRGRTALVTGGGTGIGRAIARKFAEGGAGVAIMGRRKGPLEEAAAELEGVIRGVRSGASVRIFGGVDVSDAGGVAGMFDALRGEGAALDYVINNAGVSGPVTCFANAPLDEFRSTVGIHLTGTFWTSVQALKVLRRGGKIITISTFFTEERPLEQRPYRFRSPYTASQGAKNRLAEAMSWELGDRGVASIATNPGPVHSDRIYKTVYPKAASEFVRVAGFGGLDPWQVEEACGEVLPLLGEDEEAAGRGVADAARRLAGRWGGGGGGAEELAGTLSGMLGKIRAIAEKIQGNTSRMIANREFLSQSQVAESVLALCDDGTAGILNGKVVPGDRVFYPVRPHVGAAAPGAGGADYSGRSVVFTVDPTGGADADAAAALAAHVEGRGGRAACVVSGGAPRDLRDAVAGRVHSHTADLRDPRQVTRWLDAAAANLGRVAAVVHLTGGLPEIPALTGLGREEWDGLVEKFVTTPATVAQRALEHFVPGGGRDPRLFAGAAGSVMIVGPGLPAGGKGGRAAARRMQAEVFRGALRPFTTTVNQELSEVLRSGIRLFTVLPGCVTGAEPDAGRVAGALDFLTSPRAASSSEVTFCVDESR